MSSFVQSNITKEIMVCSSKHFILLTSQQNYLKNNNIIMKHEINCLTDCRRSFKYIYMDFCGITL